MQLLTAGILLYREDGRVLLQHRDGKAKFCPNLWGFFGGKVEAGETPEEGMLREAREELGIDVKDYRPSVDRVFVDDENREGHTFLFVAPAEVQDPLVLGEGQGMDWFSWDELSKIAIVPRCLVTLRMIFEQEGWKGV